MARGRDVSKLADDVRIRVERGYKLSNPTYEIEHISADYAWIQITCCIRECGETCGVHIPSPYDEYDECSYDVETSEDGVNWRKVGLDIEELTPGTLYYVRVRTVDLPGNRCLASDWVTKTFTTVRKEIQITATSPIPLYFCAGGDAPKLIPHTVSAGILGEASQLLTGMTEADILEYYHVDFLEERVYKTVRGGYDITATWNLGKGTVHFELTPVAQVTVDIPASIAAGGIPEAIRTGRDEEITFIVKNLGTEAVVADVFLTFENHDIPRVYPHDLTGLEPLGDGYSLPGSDIMILEDAYVARRWISLGAGASGPYMLTVQLPHDAIPPGEGSATYTIKTKVGTYQ